MNIANILARKGSMAVTVQPEQSIRRRSRCWRSTTSARWSPFRAIARLGILSERDIVREAARNESFFARTVATS